MIEQTVLRRVLEEYELRLDAERANASDPVVDHSRVDAHDEATRHARSVLSDLMRRYPQHADALMSYAACAAEVEALPLIETNAEDEAALVRRGAGIAARLLAARAPAVAGDGDEVGVQVMTSLRKAIEARGLTLPRAAAMTNLTLPIIAKLDRRLISFASIPRLVIERLAGATGSTSEAIALYLRGDAQFATGASFRADEAPRMPDQQDFFEAVETDMTINDEQKQEWRRLKNKVE